MGIFSCIGKAQFPSFADANRVAQRQSRDDRKQGRKAYRCTHCHQFHIGSQGNQRTKRLARARLLEACT